MYGQNAANELYAKTRVKENLRTFRLRVTAAAALNLQRVETVPLKLACEGTQAKDFEAGEQVEATRKGAYEDSEITASALRTPRACGKPPGQTAAHKLPSNFH
jgi:hypothetical protein